MPRSTRSTPPRRPNVTIEDVASAAGVSVATVSRALRGLPNVALSTREHVTRIAEGLAYQPDPAAARLATGRTRAIALVVPLLNSWYFAQVISGAEAICTEQGYDVLVMGAPDDAARRRLLTDAAAVHRRVDGLVLVDVPLSDTDADRLAERGLAVVTIGNRSNRFPSLGIDERHVGMLAVCHLLDLGHRRIGLIAGQPEDPLGFHVPELRRQGYLRALSTAGVELDPDLEAAGNFSVTGGQDAMAALLDLDDPPTAVFAMSDEMAFGALLAARLRHRRVPEDLSIIGVDDHDVSVVLGLTTVRQSVANHGATAVRLVLAQLHGDASDIRRVQRDVELVIRDTTGPPPSR